MIEHMLTTVDNPYNPFEEFDMWNEYDTASGYHTLAFLARVVSTSHNISDADYNLAIELAMFEIEKENVLGIYRRVSRENWSDGDDDPASKLVN